MLTRIDAGAEEDFKWCPTVKVVGCMIVEPTRVMESEGPEINLEFVGPIMQERMLHHRPRLFGDRSNVSLGDAVLTMCSCSREGTNLLMLAECVLKFLRLEDSVVSMICFDTDTTGLCGAFESAWR